jgi:oxygen-independent coproporphyrinogen-3 oxidase
MSNSPPSQIGIYIHIPFCHRRCYYCHFYSLVGQNQLAAKYFHSLKQELFGYQTQLSNYQIATIFIGGGTPSVIDAEPIADLLNFIKAHFRLAAGTEITLEANPESLSPDKLETYHNSGINRLSLGLQAWQDELLTYLGRSCSPQQFLTAYTQAVKTGFSNINVDLIFGIPAQSRPQWQETLSHVIDLKPAHISCYSLELDHDSPFGRLYRQGKLQAIPADLDRHMYRMAIRMLSKAGYRQYELSNFAKPGFECRHNLDFWHGCEYLGIGASAHSYLLNQRFHNREEIKAYIANPAATKVIDETLTKKRQILELLILNLRLTDGVNISDFNHRFQTDLLKIYAHKFAKLKNQGLLSITGNTLQLTGSGMDLADRIVLELL